MRHILFAAMLALVSPSCFAAVVCPTLDEIKTEQFTDALDIPFLADGDDSKVWMLVTNHFKVNGINWNAYYHFVSGKTKEEALKMGIEKLHALSFNQTPIQSTQGKQNECVYSASDTNDRIIAYNPTMELNQSKEVTATPTNADSQIEDPDAPNKNQTAINIQGNWMHANNLTTIKFENNVHTFCNEDAVCAQGYITVNNLIKVPDWSVTGELSEDGKEIKWSNTTKWARH